MLQRGRGTTGPARRRALGSLEEGSSSEMTTTVSQPDGPLRRALEPRSWPRPPGLALIALALVGLVQSGCKSDGCSTCGVGSSIASGFRAVGSGVKSVGDFVFHHKKGCGGGSDCGCDGGSVGGMEEGMIVEQGVPVVPGGMAIPAPGTIVPPPRASRTSSSSRSPTRPRPTRPAAAGRIRPPPSRPHALPRPAAAGRVIPPASRRTVRWPDGVRTPISPCCRPLPGRPG